MFTLRDRCALVSGAGGGNGMCIVQNMLRAGMNVVLLSSREAKGLETKAKLTAMDPSWEPQIVGTGCDVANPEDVERTLKLAMESFGSVDVIVNGAGFAERQTLATTTYDAWQKGLYSSLSGTYVMTGKAIPYLAQSRAGRIINLCSVEGLTGNRERGIAASAAAGGIISFTKSAAAELAAKGITVNAVALGFAEPEMPREARTPEQEKALLDRIPTGRFLRPEDVAAAVCYLASEEASYVTGSVLELSGGLTVS